VQAVPSYKLLPLGYQMVSRLASEESTFQNVLKTILVRLAVEHPYHMLLHLLSLTHVTGSGREAAASSVLDARPFPLPCIDHSTLYRPRCSNWA
jgi:phosphatidylinositol kinase/protein kinase (PI-3  family)